MRYILFVVSIVLVSCTNNHFKLKVDCSDLESEHAAICIRGEKNLDTLAYFKDFIGYFEYETDLPSPKILYIACENSRYPLGIICQAGEYDLKLIKGGTYSYEGGDLNKLYSKTYKDKKYLEKQKKATDFAKTFDTRDEKNYKKLKELHRLYRISSQRINEIYDSLRYLSPTHAYLSTERSRSFGSDPKKTIKLINQLDKDFYHKEIKTMNANYKKECSQKALELKNGIGKKIQNFNLKDKDGKDVDLYNVISENKFTMLEFWASWCHPCCKEIPFLKKDYKNFHHKGFEIISVSVDQDENKWLKAIEKHELEWMNVRDTKDVGSKYGVTAIPLNFMIDNKGVIVAKDLRDDAVEEFLKKELEK